LSQESSEGKEEVEESEDSKDGEEEPAEEEEEEEEELVDQKETLEEGEFISFKILKFKDPAEAGIRRWRGNWTTNKQGLPKLHTGIGFMAMLEDIRAWTDANVIQSARNPSNALPPSTTSRSALSVLLAKWRESTTRSTPVRTVLKNVSTERCGSYIFSTFLGHN
jgi:hypothetical protein